MPRAAPRATWRAMRAYALMFLLLAGCGPEPAPDGAEPLSRAAFGGGFRPAHAPYGGFGGADGCTAKRTPVILLHGNSESAEDWLRPDSHGGPSSTARLLQAGYTGCEVFAVTWLPARGRSKNGSIFTTKRRPISSRASP